MNKVIFLVNKNIYNLGSYGTRVRKQIIILKNLGYQNIAVDIISNELNVFRKKREKIKEFLNVNILYNHNHYDLLKFYKIIKKYDILHAANVIPGLFAVLGSKLMRNKKVIVDCHDAIPELGLLIRNNKLEYFLYKFLEKIALTNCDSIICATPQLKTHLHRNYSKIKPIYVMRNFIENNYQGKFDFAEKMHLRKRLEIPDDKTVFVYCGSLTSWQEPEILEKLLTDFEKTNLPIHFILMTKEDQVITRFPFFNKKIVTIKKSERDEIFEYLKASDVGVILRKPHIANDLADPTKIAEYLYSGLYLFASGMENWKKIISENKIGVYVDFGTINPKFFDFSYAIKQLFLLVDSKRVNYKSISIANDLYNNELAEMSLKSAYEN